MNQTRKNIPVIVACLLLAFILFSLFSPWLTFSLQRSAIRKEIKNKIKQGVPENELIVFNYFSIAGKIKWTNGKKEFSYKGKLYDVVRKEYTPAGIVYYCIDDTQEAKLFVNLDELTKNEWQKKNRNYSGLTLLLFYHSLEEITMAPEICRHDFYYRFSSLPFSIPCPAPPPKI